MWFVICGLWLVVWVWGWDWGWGQGFGVSCLPFRFGGCIWNLSLGFVG